MSFGEKKVSDIPVIAFLQVLDEWNVLLDVQTELRSGAHFVHEECAHSDDECDCE